MTGIKQYTANELQAQMAQHITLLIDVVDNGASIGFLPPLSDNDARAYWESRMNGLQSGEIVLLVSHENDAVTGCVQLALEPRANGNHRAEIQKLMVHTSYRRRGIGRELMFTAEKFARQHNRTTIILDTRQGDPSELLYQSMDYIQAGVIPQYARSADGTLHATVFYYKLLI